MKASMEYGSEGDTLVKVIFTPESHDPSRQPDIEVVFTVREIGVYDSVYTLTKLSSTRLDTREPYELSRIQLAAASDAAANFLKSE